MALKVSLITAVYNASSTIGEALASVRSQTWTNIEHIVVDGGSTDGTLEILREHRSSISAFISEPDRGLYDALNKGIQLATGDIIGFLHADDTFASPESLSRIASVFENGNKVDAAFGDLVYVSNTDPNKQVRHWRAGPYERRLLARGWMPPHPTFYLRTEFFRDLGGFDIAYRISADYDHLLRVLWTGGVHAVYIPEVLVRMRTGGLSNRSLRNIVRKSREDYRAVRKYGVGGIATILMKNLQKIPQFMAG